jgi:hypothetical protein
MIDRDCVVNWPAVASWLRKEASEHIKRAAVQAHEGRSHAERLSRQNADIFMGLARAIDYGVETQQLADSKERFFGEIPL